MNSSQKAWIDKASYETLLRKWRFAPITGDSWFQDKKLTTYFKRRMIELRNAEPDGGVGASKRVGW